MMINAIDVILDMYSLGHVSSTTNLTPFAKTDLELAKILFIRQVERTL